MVSPENSNDLPWDITVDINNPITSKTRTAADAIFAKISLGTYHYGTRLPAERILCEELGISRNTIRKALALLEEHKVILREPGSSPVITYQAKKTNKTSKAATIGALVDNSAGFNFSLEIDEIGQITSPLELGVVRSIIEPEIARLAVLSMTSRDIQKMNEIQLQIQSVTIDSELYCELDDQLRMHIAKGTHNPLLVCIYQMLNHVNQSADWAEQRRKSLTPSRIRECKVSSKSLCDAITNRQIEATVENLKLSLAQFHEDLMRAV